ncbi:MAG: hypothetical protein EBY22_04390 [Gammaproteobacteria bacterium]|nr:hypothetical protein [Gammaproteobacteria bacterium]
MADSRAELGENPEHVVRQEHEGSDNVVDIGLRKASASKISHTDRVFDNSGPDSEQEEDQLSVDEGKAHRDSAKKPSILQSGVDSMPIEQSEHDRSTTQTISNLYQEIGALKFRLGNLKDGGLIGAPNDEDTHDKLVEKLSDGYKLLDEATTQKTIAVGATAIAAADQRLGQAYESIEKAAHAILKFTVNQNLGKIESPLFAEQIRLLKLQLSETIRLEKSAVKPTSSWSLRSFWATDKNAQASRSVQKLAKNSAFAEANLADQTKEQLKINERILRLMTHAMYALTTFDQASVSTSGSASNLNSDGATSSWHQTPLKDISGVSCAKGVNESVMDFIRSDLAEIQNEAGGLIGSSNPNRQFWGRVLMVLALVIATMVAAVAVMSMLGFATPAFLVPYFAAIQASSMVSTVLNFVAAKLTLDLNTAAAIEA